MEEEDVLHKLINNNGTTINIYMMDFFHQEQYGLFRDLPNKHLICGGSHIYQISLLQLL
jgi:hypothetical protein